MDNVVVTPEIVDMALVKADTVNPVEVFTGDSLSSILREIERQATSINANIETAKGRKVIASTAHKVAKSKVVLDNLGKALTAEWKAKAKQVDESRRESREFLDALKVRVRKPLTEWEESEKIRKEAERLEKEIAEAHEAAIAENILFDRQREIELREVELARQEAERKAKEEAERLEQERKEREDRLKKEAAERATREAEEKAERERQAVLLREREAKEAAEKAERARIAAEERAKLEKEAAEQAAKAATERAEREKIKAVEEEKRRAREEAEHKERERIAAEKAAKIEAERKAADEDHRATIKREALSSLISNGFSEDDGKRIIRLIVNGEIQHVTINY